MPRVLARRRDAARVGAASAPATPARRVVIVVKLPHFDLAAAQPAGPLRRRGSTCRIFLLAFVALLGIFYISTFIDLADKLFRGVGDDAACCSATSIS